MSNNCLITKLKGSIDNENLPQYGECIVTGMVKTVDANFGAKGRGFSGSGLIAKILDERYQFANAQNEPIGRTIEGDNLFLLLYNSGDASLLNKKVDIHLTSKYTLTTMWNGNYGGFGALPISMFKYSTKLQSFGGDNSAVYGDISDVATLPQLRFMCFGNCYDAYGTLEDFTEKQIQNGRTSGTIALQNVTFGNIKFNGVGGDKSGTGTIVYNGNTATVTYKFKDEENTMIGTFDGSHWTYSGF